jgi:succinoglycan biosynthesis protein ExoH
VNYSFTFDVTNLDVASFLRALTAWNGLPLNPPTYFLRDLFVCCLLVPLIYALFRASVWVALAAVLLAYLSGYLEMLMLRPDILIMFVVGGMLAIKQVNLTVLDRHAKTMALVYIMCSVLVTLWACLADSAMVARYFDSVLEVMRLSSAFLIWPAAVLILKTSFAERLLKESPMAFFIFNSHAPVLIALNILWLSLIAKLLPNSLADGNQLLASVFFFLAPVLTFLIIRMAYQFLQRLPLLLGLLTGNRYR